MKVLILDDDFNLTEMMSDLITYQSPDIVPIVTNSPHEALDLIKVNPDISVILCDVKMPGMDGFEFLRRLRESKVKTPLVFISAVPSLHNKLVGRQLGAVGFLSKPFKSQDLVDAIIRADNYAKIITTKGEILHPVAEILISQPGSTPVLKQLASDYTIGRSDDSDIKLLPPQSSREHALLNRTEESYTSNDCKYHYRVIDYSRNGVSVNGRRVSGYKLLSHNDIISFPGGCEMRYFVLLLESSDPKGTQ